MKIGVVTRPNSDAAASAVELLAGLAAQHGMQVGSVEERGSGVTLEPDRMADCDVVIAIGGDGTVLEAVRYGVPNDLPVLGVNVGRVGFLAEAELDDLPVVVDVIAGRSWSEMSRMTLTSSIEGGGTGVGLNDIVVEKINSQQLVSLELHIDGERFLTYRADGLVFATPTGSTAYNLSAGGPIVDPLIDTTIVTPVAPYSMFARALCLPPTSKIVCTVTLDRPAGVSADGVVVGTLDPGNSVTIERGPSRARFITLAKRSYLQTVKAKLKLYEGLDGASF